MRLAGTFVSTRTKSVARAIALSLALGAGVAQAADHVDLPQSGTGSPTNTLDRPDAAITDFFAFVTGNKLVMILDVNPFLPSSVRNYTFPTDVTYSFKIDKNSPVTFTNAVDKAEFGGTITYPAGISEDITLNVTFGPGGAPRLQAIGVATQHVRVFAGLRAEAFIFAPFVRNNIGGIVVEIPLSKVVGGQSTLLTWGTTSVTTPAGTYTELGGRALRSQFTPFVNLNALHPSQHVANGFGRPDVVIIDTSKPTAFPNGRALVDDVVDIAAGFTSLPTDAGAAGLEFDLCAPGGAFAPCPVAPSATADDVRIKGNYPYLGAPYGSGLQD